MHSFWIGLTGWMGLLILLRIRNHHYFGRGLKWIALNYVFQALLVVSKSFGIEGVDLSEKGFRMLAETICLLNALASWHYDTRLSKVVRKRAVPLITSLWLSSMVAEANSKNVSDSIFALASFTAVLYSAPTAFRFVRAVGKAPNRNAVLVLFILHFIFLSFNTCEVVVGIPSYSGHFVWWLDSLSYMIVFLCFLQIEFKNCPGNLQ